MKPLAYWLADQDGPTVVAIADPGISGGELIPALTESAEERIETSCDEREHQLPHQRAEEQLNEARRLHADAERQLRQELGQELTDRIVEEIGEAIEELLSIIEESLYRVLLPFLGDQAGTRAVGELLALVQAELRRVELPVLEIRAPSELHCVLDAVRGGNVSVGLVEADVIEIVLATHRLRFEELSLQWRNSIEGKVP